HSPLLLCSLDRYRGPPHLHSFPTRRSSDLDLNRARALLIHGRLPENLARGGVSSGAAVWRPTMITGPDTVQSPRPARRVTAALKDRKSTRLNSSHVKISYAVFCLKKKRVNE